MLAHSRVRGSWRAIGIFNSSQESVGMGEPDQVYNRGIFEQPAP